MTTPQAPTTLDAASLCALDGSSNSPPVQRGGYLFLWRRQKKAAT